MRLYWEAFSTPPSPTISPPLSLSILPLPYFPSPLPSFPSRHLRDDPTAWRVSRVTKARYRQDNSRRNYSREADECWKQWLSALHCVAFCRNHSHAPMACTLTIYGHTLSNYLGLLCGAYLHIEIYLCNRVYVYHYSLKLA